MDKLGDILKFTELMQQYRAIERRLLVRGSERRENDAEHSFSLAMLAWYIHSTYKLDLNLEKIFLYALAHDLVEIYAGDVPFHDTESEQAISKHQRELEAAQRLKSELPEFSELHPIINSYENRSDKESRFVYALDKVEPMLSVYLDKGRTWRKNDVTLDILKEVKTPKVALDPTVDAIFKDMIKLLETDEDTLFNQ